MLNIAYLSKVELKSSCDLTKRQLRFRELQYEMCLRRKYVGMAILDEWIRIGYVPWVVSKEKLLADFPPVRIKAQGTTSSRRPRQGDIFTEAMCVKLDFFESKQITIKEDFSTIQFLGISK